MDSDAVCGRVSMSGMVARQLDGRDGRYLAYFSTNGARLSRVGYIGATLRFLGLGKGWRAFSERQHDRPHSSTKKRGALALRSMLDMTRACERTSPKNICTTQPAHVTSSVRGPQTPEQTSWPSITSPGRGSRQNSSALCERLSPSMCPSSIAAGGM
jgi:hypothetical protein